jgi:hypothetical protein
MAVRHKEGTLKMSGGRKFQRLNVIGTLWGGKTFAEYCYSESTTSNFFEWWFKEQLVREVARGSTILLDNASFHSKKHLTSIAPEAKFNVLFLPPYSPDLNPKKKYGRI